MKNKTWALSALSIAACLATQAYAQEASSAADAINSASVNATQTLPAVTVTARKRNELNQDVPGSVAVVTDKQIERNHIKSVDELAKLTAGLTFDADFGRLQDRPILRGQSTIIGETGVSYFVDGVYYTGSILDFNLADVASIEVIKGPQSALYGRNTYAGAISIKTKAPTTQWSGALKLEAAQFGQKEVSASVSGPLIKDLLGVSLSASSYERDGVTGDLWRNKFDGEAQGRERSKSVNIGTYWTPSEQLDVRTRFYYTKQNDGAPPLFLQGYEQNNCFFDNGNRRPTVTDATGTPVAGGAGSVYLGAGRYYCGEIKAKQINVDQNRSLGVEPVNASERFLGAVTAEYRFNEKTALTYTFGTNTNNSHAAYDADAQATSYGPFLTSSVGLRPRTSTADTGDYEYAVSTGAPAVNFSAVEAGKSTDYSHELRLRHKDGIWDFLLGGYVYRSHNDSTFKQTPLAGWGDQLTESLKVLQARMQAACDTFFQNRAGFANCTSIVRRASSLSATAIPFDRTTGLWTTFPDGSSHGSSENIAWFGSATVKAAKDLELSGELRVAHETQEVLPGTQNDKAYFTDLTENTAFSSASETPYQKATFKAVTPRFTARYDLSSDNHLYAVVAKGNKPGGLNGVKAAAVGYGTFGEETAWSYELGSKNTFLNNRLLVNIAAFENRISGYQLTDSIVYADGGTSTARKNIGKAKIQGLELEVSYLPAGMPGLDLHGNLAVTKAKLIDGLDATQGVLNDIADNGQLDCSQGLAPAYAALVDKIRADGGIPASTVICHNFDGTTYFGKYGSVAGRTLPRVPKFSVNLGFDYAHHLAGGWVLNVGSNFSVEGRKYVQTDNLAWYGAAKTLSAHVGISDGRFGLSLWGKNLTNEDSAAAVSRFTDATNQNLRAFFGTPRLPRQIGVTASYKY